MNYRLDRVLRDAIAAVLLAVSRSLARAAARTVGHPSARAEKVVPGPWLHVVTNHVAEHDAARFEREAATLRRIGGHR